MKGPALGLLGILLLSGCVAPPPEGIADATAPASLREPRVVVALVDSGINPYHEVFRSTALADLEASDIVDARTGMRPIRVNLTLGPDFDANMEADASFWDQVETERVYAFEGTNILAVSFMPASDTRPIQDEVVSHGTGTAGAVARASPDIIILMIEAYSTTSGTIGKEAMALEWAVEQPWIDVISLSFGFPVHYPGLERLPEILRRGAENGKVIVASAGNYPAASLAEETAGPPWVLAAGGVIPEDAGEAAITGKAANYVSDFEGTGPSNRHTTEADSFIGTSLAAPTVAGEIAQTVRALRGALGHRGGIRDGALVEAGATRLDRWDIIEAFNRTATYWSTLDYRPNAGGHPVNVAISASLPILPAPWLQMGWGYVGPGTAEAATAFLLGIEEPEPKPPEAVAHMRAVDAARWAYWG